MLRLGLRAREVATLRLDDLDWRAGQLTVHGKGGRVDQLPLPVDVGEAIAAYLRRGRPRDAGGAGGVPAGATAASRHDAWRGDGHRRCAPHVAPGSAWCAPHRLRHTAATDMLRAGAPLAEIGQVLRHRSPGSTAVYARVDVERLRTIARPWPTGAGS